MAAVVKALDSPEPMQRNSSVTPGEGDRRVVVPPVHVPNARNNLLVTSALEARASVSALNSASPPRPKNTAGRCFRCGNRRDGPNHGGGAKSNSEAFCTTLQDQCHRNWVTVAGHAVDDQRKKLKRRPVIKWWKGVRQQQKMDEDPDFEGWQSCSL